MATAKITTTDRSDLLRKIVSLICYSIVFVIIGRFSLRYSSKISEFLSNYPGKYIGILLMLLVSLVFFYFRKKQQFWHGILLTIFAIPFTFISFKFMVFKVAGNEELSAYDLAMQSLRNLKPILYLLLVTTGVSDIINGWKKSFYFDSLSRKGLSIIASFKYGRKSLLLVASLTIIPAYYSIYLSFLDDPVAILKKECYVRETSNRNDHPRIAEFNQSYHILPANTSYCGTSLEWAIKKAGWELDVDFAPRAKNWALKQKNIVWRQNGAVCGKNPTRNDVVVCFDRGNWHVGLLEDWQEGSAYCKTVEANTTDYNVESIKTPTNREGIYHGKLRNKKEIYCVVRPYSVPAY